MATTIETVNLGISANDGTGDPLRTGGEKLNRNDQKLFNLSNKIDEGKLQIYKYPGNTDISTTEQNDFVSGIIESGGVKYFIKAQYNTGSLTDFGTEANGFNDGSYTTLDYINLL